MQEPPAATRGTRKKTVRKSEPVQKLEPIQEIIQDAPQPEILLRRASEQGEMEIEGEIKSIPHITASYNDAVTIALRPSSLIPLRKTAVNYTLDQYDEPQRRPTSTRRYQTTDPKMQRQEPRYPIVKAIQPPNARKPIRFTPATLLAAGATFIVLLIVLTMVIPPAVQKAMDDKNYGYPRTYQIDKNVGHGGTSHFIAINLKGSIALIELYPDHKVKIYDVVRLAGNNADMPPATITFTQDEKPNIEVTVNGTVYLFLNNGKEFAPSH